MANDESISAHLGQFRDGVQAVRTSRTFLRNALTQLSETLSPIFAEIALEEEWDQKVPVYVPSTGVVAQATLCIAKPGGAFKMCLKINTASQAVALEEFNVDGALAVIEALPRFLNWFAEKAKAEKREVAGLWIQEHLKHARLVVEFPGPKLDVKS